MPGRSEQPPPESGARRAPGSPRRLSTRCCAAVHGSSRLKRRNPVGPVVGRGAHVAGKEGGRGSGRCPRRGHGVSGSLDPVFLCRIPPGASPLMRGRRRTGPAGEPARELASAAGTPPPEPHCWLGAPPPVAAGVRLSPGALVRTACDYHSRWSTSERHGGTLRRRGRGATVARGGDWHRRAMTAPESQDCGEAAVSAQLHGASRPPSGYVAPAKMGAVCKEP